MPLLMVIDEASTKNNEAMKSTLNFTIAIIDTISKPTGFHLRSQLAINENFAFVIVYTDSNNKLEVFVKSYSFELVEKKLEEYPDEAVFVISLEKTTNRIVSFILEELTRNLL